MIILLGGPGTGKSTQGQLLSQRGKLRWISMGGVLRNKATHRQQKRIQKGNLLGDEETIQILKKELIEVGDKPELILDGFPRNVEQAKWLVRQNLEMKIRLSAVINLAASMEVAKKRLLDRGRSDDNEKVISNRFKIYEHTSSPAVETLKKSGIPTLHINAENTPQGICEDIVAGLAGLGIEA